MAVVDSVAEPALTLPDMASIAVLAFANLSGDPEQEYWPTALWKTSSLSCPASAICS
jgi:TolB-like protein